MGNYLVIVSSKCLLFQKDCELSYWVYDSALSSYQVCAVGRFPHVGAAMIWNLGQSSENPPGGS